MTVTAVILAILAFLQSQVAVVLAYLAYKGSQVPSIETWEDEKDSPLLSEAEQKEIDIRRKLAAEKARAPQSWDEHEAEFRRLYDQ